MLKLLLDSGGEVTGDELFRRFGGSIDSIRESRKRLEETYLVKDYSVDPTKFGLRRIDLLIYTNGKKTMGIGRALLKRKEVSSVTRMIGEHTIDLMVEVLVEDYRELLNVIEGDKSRRWSKGCGLD